MNPNQIDQAYSVYTSGLMGQQQIHDYVQMTNRNAKVSMITGDKPLVVCGTETVSCKDMDEAQRKAEELAHKLSANAYILKPVRLVAPKRDVVTTELS